MAMLLSDSATTIEGGTLPEHSLITFSILIS